VKTPDWWAALVMALAVFRVYRLIAEDDIADRPREWLLAKLKEERLVQLDKLITCPWCLGWWLSLGVYLFWLWLPTETLVVCTPFALSAVVALISKNLDK